MSLLFSALAACGSSGGGDQPAPNHEAETSNSLTSIPPQALGSIVERLAFRTAPVEDPSCVAGADAVSFWIDQDQDKQYDSNIDQGFQETIVCKEAEGTSPQGRMSSGSQGRADLAEFPELWLNFALTQASADLCPNGGFALRFWIEAKNAGHEAAAGPNQSISLPVCSGKDGKDGRPGLDGRSSFLSTERLAHSPACPGQATKIITYLDLDGDQKFDAAIDQNYTENTVCDGKNGLSQALSTKAVAAGKECPNGGLKIQLWTDLNGNKRYDLDSDSDFEERLICQGKQGKDGKNGKNGKNGIDGINGFSSVIRTISAEELAPCQGPGYQILTFTDHNANGEFDEGVDSGYAENHICHGKNGISAALSVENLEFDETCQARAVLLKTWSDLDADQIYNEKKDAGYHEQLICHGKDFRNDFFGSFYSETELLKFDLQHFARLQQLEDGARVATYGKFAHYTMSVEKILVFEPEFHECKDDQRQIIVQMSHAQFLQQLQGSYQEMSQKFKNDLQDSLDQSAATAQKISSLEAQLLNAQTEWEHAQEGIQNTHAKLSETNNQRDVTLALLRDLAGKIERQELLIAEQAIVVKGQQEKLVLLNAQQQTLTQELTQLRAKVASSQRKVDDLQIRLKGSESDLQGQNHQLKLVLDEISQLNAEINRITLEMKKPFVGLFPYLALEDRLKAQTKLLAAKSGKQKDLTATLAKGQKQVQGIKDEIVVAIAALNLERQDLSELEFLMQQVIGATAAQAKLAGTEENHLQNQKQAIADLKIVQKNLGEKAQELEESLGSLMIAQSDFSANDKKWQETVLEVERILGQERLSAVASVKATIAIEQEIADLDHRFALQTTIQKFVYEIGSDGNLLLCGDNCAGNSMAFARGSENLQWPEVTSSCGAYIHSLLGN